MLSIKVAVSQLVAGSRFETFSPVGPTKILNGIYGQLALQAASVTFALREKEGLGETFGPQHRR